MIPPTDNLRRHIARRATRIRRIIGLILPGHPQIREPQIASPIKDQVLRLQIPMNDIIEMQVLQRCDNTRHHKFGLGLREFPAVAEVVAQVAAVYVVHDQVQGLRVLERVDHVHEERVG